MLITAAHAAALLLVSTASAIPLVARYANATLAIWDRSPGPTCYSSADYSCNSKNLLAVATAFPVTLDLVEFPYSPNTSQQTVPSSGGNYSAVPGYPFTISWDAPDLGDQLFAFRLTDANGDAAYTLLPGYTVSGNYCRSSSTRETEQGCSWIGPRDPESDYDMIMAVGAVFFVAVYGFLIIGTVVRPDLMKD